MKKEKELKEKKEEEKENKKYVQNDMKFFGKKVQRNSII